MVVHFKDTYWEKEDSVCWQSGIKQRLRLVVIKVTFNKNVKEFENVKATRTLLEVDALLPIFQELKKITQYFKVL